MPSAVQSIADAIKEGFGFLKVYKEKKHVTRLRAAVDYGEKYILENESDEPSEKKLAKYKSRFYRYNQG